MKIYTHKQFSLSTSMIIICFFLGSLLFLGPSLGLADELGESRVDSIKTIGYEQKIAELSDEAQGFVLDDSTSGTPTLQEVGLANDRNSGELFVESEEGSEGGESGEPGVVPLPYYPPEYDHFLGNFNVKVFYTEIETEEARGGGYLPKYDPVTEESIPKQGGRAPVVEIYGGTGYSKEPGPSGALTYVAGKNMVVELPNVSLQPPRFYKSDDSDDEEDDSDDEEDDSDPGVGDSRVADVTAEEHNEGDVADYIGNWPLHVEGATVVSLSGGSVSISSSDSGLLKVSTTVTSDDWQYRYETSLLCTGIQWGPNSVAYSNTWSGDVEITLIISKWSRMANDYLYEDHIVKTLTEDSYGYAHAWGPQDIAWDQAGFSVDGLASPAEWFSVT